MLYVLQHTCGTISPSFVLCATTLLVTSQDFIKFWSEIFVFVLLVLIEISQGFNFFLSLFKSFIGKTISNFILFLEELF
jgi:hypothetical protein